MPIIGIPESGRTRVYRKIVAQLRTDPVLEAAGIDWIPWDGSTKHVLPTVVNRPTIVLYPTLGPMRVDSPDSQRGDMTITVEMYVPGTFDVCDCLDLWTAVELAIYRPDDRAAQLAFEAALRGEGCDAMTGEIDFTPATIQSRFHENGTFANFYAAGSMSIAVQRPINP